MDLASFAFGFLCSVVCSLHSGFALLDCRNNIQIVNRKERMRKPCCDKEGRNKGAWSKQEDQKLIDHIRTHGEGCWRAIPKAAGLHRCGKSCRLRWINYLRPDIKRGNFGQDEEDLIIKLHALLGNRWSLIAGRLPGRTDNEVKNYWNSHIQKKLIKMGIDPKNHKLHQSFPRPQPQPVSGGSPSSGSMNKEHKRNQPFDDKSNNIRAPDNNDKSCLEDVALNLDLTIAFPSPGLALVEDEPKPNAESTKTKDNVDGLQSASTLPLFR